MQVDSFSIYIFFRKHWENYYIAVSLWKNEKRKWKHSQGLPVLSVMAEISASVSQTSNRQQIMAQFFYWEAGIDRLSWL